jgi:signal transduction histidine kinase/ketosteroid isomerase-like protein
MKLTKKQEQEIMQVYEAYWAEYLNGNVNGMVPLLDASYTQVGSAESEVFSTKKEAVQFLVDTIDQVAGKLEMRNRSTNLEQQNGLVLIHELCDLYALADKKWAFYSKFRATTLLTEKKEGWKIIHQHSSFPDSKTEEGQNVAIDKIAEENRELREAVKRRTVELEQKNRELEIETALEKVRSRSMAMHKSEELADLSLELVKQVQALGVATWFCAFNIYDDDQSGSLEWGSNGQGTFPKYRTPREGIFLRYYKAGQRGESLLINEIGEKECPGHYEYLCTLPGVGEQLLKMKDSGIPFPKSQIDHVAFFKYGYILFITFEPAPEAHEIFKRFAKVFEQTYTRFLDLQKAEAQARESEIELALERVRARSMAMQNSEELQEVIRIIFDQLSHLSINAEHAGIVVDYEPKKDWHFWVAESRDIPAKITVPNLDLIWDRQFVDAKKNGKKLFTTLLNFEEKNAFYKELLPHIEGLTQEMQDHYFKRDGLAISTSLQKDIGLYIENFSGTPYSEEENSILMRFAKVFQQTYTRFLDLQKAEAQAREAQIEAALEKVRSRSLAMHNSDELKEVVAVVLEKLQELNIAMDSRVAVIVVFKEGSTDFNQWVASPTDIRNTYISTPYFEHIILSDFWKAKESGLDFYSKSYSIDEKNKYFEHFFEHSFFKNFVGIEDQKKWALEKEFYTYSPAFEKNSSLGIADFSGEPLSENEIAIIKRFAKVFEQAYIRFLDLQKAEAQAREAQIEAALERVRSKTMAMHNSNDVGDTVVTLFDEVLKLGLDKSIRIGIGILEGYEGMETWSVTSTPKGKVDLKMGMLDMTIHPMLTGLKKAWKSGKKCYSYDYIGDDVYRYYKALNNESEYPFEADLDSLPENEYHKSFFYKEGILFSFAPNPISEEATMVLNRFAGVFGQTYRRYLDLQKAEAQVREAQIETALEKVRSQSLAMHTTSEMQLVANAVYDQLRELGIEMEAVGMSGVIAAKEDYDVWVGGVPFGKALRIPYNENTKVQREYNKMLQERPELFVKTYSGKVKEEYINHLLTHGDFPKALKKKMKTSEAFTTSIALANKSSIQILRYTNHPYTGEENEILVRFSKVFEQAYIRFMDLQKAEEQAQESQIEAALEKVRSRSLAMHTPNELQEVVTVVGEKLQELGVILDKGGVVICTYYPDSKDVMHWTATFDDTHPSIPYYLPYFDSPIFIETWASKNSGVDFFEKIFSYKDKNHFFLHAFKHSDYKNLPEEYKKEILTVENHALSFAWQTNSALMIPSHNGNLLPEEHKTILKRFAKVFEQAYIRFMDLQKAEAQAREAQIEAALEKVRSRTMAMHKSKEMLEVIGVVSEQLQQLNLNFDTVSFAKNNQEGDFTFWITSKGQPKPILMEVPTLDSPILKGVYKAQKKGIAFLADVFSSKENREWHEHLIKYSDLKHFPDKIKDFILNAPGFARSSFLLKNIDLYVGNYRAIPFSDEENSIFRRFAHVFEQSYTRFLDLQKAEAQAKEAQIENALEKVRSRTMAMQKGEEVKDVVVLLYKELIKLGLTNFVTCGYVEINEITNRQETWVTNPGGDSLGLFYLPLTGDATFDERYAAWKKQQVVFHQKVAGEVRSKHLEYAITTFNSKEAEEMVLGQFPDPCVFYCFNFSHGYLHIVTGSKLKEEEESLLARFTRVFEQTYARFLDLKKAEAQTREAQIENALEKVRSRTMAMQKSEELPEAANNLFLQVQELGIPAWSAGYCIWETEDKKAASCNMSSEGEIQKSFILPTIGEGYNFYDPLKKGEAFYIEELGGDALVKHYEFMQTLPKVGKILEELINAGLSLPTFQIFHILYFPHGYLMFITYEQVPEAHDIFKRFAKVFEQTYTRFLDLKKAEAQAREATKQASLDRVRGQIASMRSTADLNRITPLVWNELTTMGVPFIRCGVFIIDEPTEIVEVYLSAPDGHSLGVLNLKFNADPLTKNTVVHWRKGKIFKAHWNREEFISWTQSLMDQGQISDKNTYQGAANPPKSLDLHFIPFTQGMLYVGSENPLNDRHIELVQSLADAFAIAYARYEDFTKLEKAKQSVEATLSELKATQNQLVQSEKMASLGELTAGIAHEIQNPLNFVNNFSEVSGELIEEMNEEIEKGDMEEAKAIANDVKQNLEKILHHGKRADAIVKGMLQHSRSSTGVKEPTDINALADEYLRLAYHGLRAKDKSFNATMKTDYDDSLEKVNVIPQDIGRVILNLITNAFYVVDEKKKRLKDGYEPTVSVRTIKGAGKIEISIKDNGNGIPDKVKEKIFQPFFTTKPTGKGTGLGLSMSYDIVNKGHGGELKVETTEGEGTTFTIALPMV